MDKMGGDKMDKMGGDKAGMDGMDGKDKMDWEDFKKGEMDGEMDDMAAIKKAKKLQGRDGGVREAANWFTLDPPIPAFASIMGLIHRFGNRIEEIGPSMSKLHLVSTNCFT